MSLDATSYQAVLFDFDGVIADSEPLHEQVIGQVLRDLAVPLEGDDYKQYFIGRPDEPAFQEYLTQKDSRTSAKAAMQQKIDAYVEGVKTIEAYEDARRLIKQLKAHNVPLAVVTSSRRAEVDAALEKFLLRDSFQCIISIEDVTRGKPDPECYEQAAELLAVEPANCLVIEDTPAGIQAARKAGMDCVAVTNTFAATELTEATFVVKSLDELIRS